MKAIHNQLLYDTETGTKLAEMENGLMQTTTLYRAPNGHYFIHVTGTPSPATGSTETLYPTSVDTAIRICTAAAGLDKTVELFAIKEA